MNKTFAVCLALSAGVVAAEPEVVIECPAGTHFVKGKGCQATIVEPGPACPAGTRPSGKKCVAVVDTSCPAGFTFVTGTGCVKGATQEAPPPPPPQPATTAKAPSDNPKKGGTFKSGLFSDRLRSSCGGLEVEVHGGSRLTGVTAMVLVNGARVGDETEVNVGQVKNITGTVGGKELDLRITQAVFGTRYLLKVGGVECKLTK